MLYALFVYHTMTFSTFTKHRDDDKISDCDSLRRAIVCDEKILEEGQRKMNIPNVNLQLHVGQRNIKTAIAATLCALMYFIVGRNPTFACIGVIFGLGSDMPNSRLNGGNRFFGTLFGGFLGMLLFRLYIVFYPQGGLHAPLLIFLFVGVVSLIVVSQVFNWPGAVQPGGVVLCILLFNTPVETYVAYSLNRIIDTGIGVVVALLVNWLLPRERVVRWLEAIRVRR